MRIGEVDPILRTSYGNDELLVTSLFSRCCPAYSMYCSLSLRHFVGFFILSAAFFTMASVRCDEIRLLCGVVSRQAIETGCRHPRS